MALIDALLQEFDQETPTTRRVLERVTDEHLGWRPHPKGRTLGELALHVATLPAGIATIALPSEVQAPNFKDPVPASAAELLPALDASIATVKRLLGGMDDATFTGEWRLLLGDKVLFAVPRSTFLRSTLLNHWYHHRGQLTVYLRALDLGVPSIYGPSGDENTFTA
jgi:uncharacterized damage-inducible protein DinB